MELHLAPLGDSQILEVMKVMVPWRFLEMRLGNVSSVQPILKHSEHPHATSTNKPNPTVFSAR